MGGSSPCMCAQAQPGGVQHIEKKSFLRKTKILNITFGLFNLTSGWPDNKGQRSSAGSRKRKTFDSSRSAKPHSGWRTQWATPDTLPFGAWRLWLCPWHASQSWGKAQSPSWSNWRASYWQRRRQREREGEMPRSSASCFESHKSKYSALHGSSTWNAARHQGGSAWGTGGCPSEPSKAKNSLPNVVSFAASVTLPHFLYRFHPQVCKVFKVNLSKLHLFEAPIPILVNLPFFCQAPFCQRNHLTFSPRGERQRWGL